VIGVKDLIIITIKINIAKKYVKVVVREMKNMEKKVSKIVNNVLEDIYIIFQAMHIMIVIGMSVSLL
jgi:hypothetical protein